jgi:uncharacterized protein (TIGR03435 family)
MTAASSIALKWNSNTQPVSNRIDKAASMGRRLHLLLAIGLAVPALVQAQAIFEVASVKANVSGDRRASLQMNLPDGFTATNQTLQSLISIVYQIPAYRMSGGPDWLPSARFDVNAKADHRITIDEKREMIRSLFEDRFKLKTHRETRETRIYALVRARKDGELGPNLKPTSYDCPEIQAARQRGDVSAVPAPKPGEPPPCGAFGGIQFRARGVQMASFAATLAAMMREMVVDETGLTGWWDFDVTLNFTGFSGPAVGGADPSSDTTSVFTSLQEQLGLKLDPRRGPVETFVIDHVERPTSD